MSALLSDVELAVLTAVIARGELLTNGDAQRLRGHIDALGEKYAAATALAEATHTWNRSLESLGDGGVEPPDEAWDAHDAATTRFQEALAKFRATR